jgi:ribosomal protein S3
LKKLEIQITKSQHRLIIGKSGSAVQEIFKDFDVYVLVPRADHVSETISLYGDDSKLGAALTQVYSKANSVITTQIVVPSWLHRYIIGDKGANISKITADFPGVHVNFEKDNKIVLDGPPDEVEKVQKTLTSIANDLQQVMYYEEITVETKYCGHIIGKNYENIARLRQEYGVSIRLPQDTNSTKTIIRIEGIFFNFKHKFKNNILVFPK